MNNPAEHGSAGHETTDAHARPLAVIGISMAIFIPTVFLGIVVVFKVLDYYQPLLEDPEPHPLAATRQTSSAPRIQIDPPRQMLDLQQIEENVLTTYDWVDQEKNIVRIPIKRAIDILTKRKLPVKTGSPAVEAEQP